LQVIQIAEKVRRYSVEGSRFGECGQSIGSTPGGASIRGILMDTHLGRASILLPDPVQIRFSIADQVAPQDRLIAYLFRLTPCNSPIRGLDIVEAIGMSL